MIEFDTAVLMFLNRFARTSWSLDHLIVFVSESHLFKGGALAALIWGLWFRDGDNSQRRRERLVVTLVTAVIAIGVGRALALLLPFRTRPVHNPDIAFILPHGARQGIMESWSAFPSDHAVLFFSMAMGIWFASRTAGKLAAAYVLVVIALPRLYLGLHYPTDILAGAAVGITIALLAHLTSLRHWVIRPAGHWIRTSPVSFYGCLFLLSFQMAVLFEDLRDLGNILVDLIGASI